MVIIVIVVLVGSVPVGGSVSPKLFFRETAPKSQIVLILRFSFFDFIVFIVNGFGSKLLGYEKSMNFITQRGVWYM